MNLVLVEDDDMLRKSLAYFLKNNGFHVFDFDNGEDAIHYIRDNHQTIQVIVTDLNLPFAGGKQVLFEAKGYDKIVKVVLTSLNVEANELEVFDLGADDFISKPFSPQVLLKRIKKYLPSNPNV